jgi:inorganic pyrophosphatase
MQSVTIFPVVIEMPRGDTRRRHMGYDKTGFIDLGPISEVISVNDGIMPAHYGYIPDTPNTAEGDDVDVIIVDDMSTEVGERVNAKALALLTREDEDNKVVAVRPDSPLQIWEELPTDLQQLLLAYFGSNSPIKKIEDASAASRYISDSASNLNDTPPN